MEVITSAQNSKIKLVRALLGRPTERHEAGEFVAEGVRLLEEAVNSNWGFRFALYDETLNDRGRLLVKDLESRGVEVEQVLEKLMRSLSETESPQGILAILQFLKLSLPISPTFILIPDQIRDPGNLGTLLRSADAAGVDAVLIPPETTDPFAPKVVRAGMGAHFRLPIHEMTWEEIERVASGGASHLTPQEKSHPSSATHSRLEILLADMEGKSCWEIDLRQPLALIVGGEAEGASEQARKLMNQKISIPMARRTESINAAVAGSVLMFEAVRQRK